MRARLTILYMYCTIYLHPNAPFGTSRACCCRLHRGSSYFVPKPVAAVVKKPLIERALAARAFAAVYDARDSTVYSKRLRSFSPHARVCNSIEIQSRVSKISSMVPDQTNNRTASHVRPPIPNKHLHLIDQTKRAPLHILIRLQPPSLNPPLHNHLFQPSRRTPSLQPIHPRPIQNPKSRNPRSISSRVNSSIRERIIAHPYAWIDPHAMSPRKRIISMNQTTL